VPAEVEAIGICSILIAIGRRHDLCPMGRFGLALDPGTNLVVELKKWAGPFWRTPDRMSAQRNDRIAIGSVNS
jgi:hypothetical protein